MREHLGGQSALPIDGQTISKGTIVVPQLSVILIDPQFSAANEPPTLRKAFGGASTMTAPYKCRVTKRF
ncbi:hypothetical protein M3Y99_01913500 [Aphelenchoides fujianensis]|nr:hypothetical protein M3Y99_01913500 [Aphelenchoides fujianensis]